MARTFTKDEAEKLRIAEAIWNKGVADHEVAIEYFRARGIDLDALPPCIRFVDQVTRQGQRERIVVLRLTSPSGDFLGIQRIFLHERHPRKRDRMAKLSLGPVGGGEGDNGHGAVHFGDVRNADQVIVCEGPETGLALHLATGIPVWSCLGTSGMKALELPPRHAEIIIAADLDSVKRRQDGSLHQRFRPGTEAAWWLFERALRDDRRCRIAVPQAEELVGEVNSFDGIRDPVDGGVDWLDVYVGLGAQAVRDGLELAWGVDEGQDPGPMASFNWDVTHATERKPIETEATVQVVDSMEIRNPYIERVDGYNRPFISHGYVEQARAFLIDECLLDDARRWRLARWAGKWWWYTGRQWTEYPEEELRAFVCCWINNFLAWKAGKSPNDVDDPAKAQCKRIYATASMANEIIDKLTIEATVRGNEMPMWIPPTIGESGVPYWGAAAMRAGEGAPDPLVAGNPSRVIVFENGILSIDDLIRGEIVLHPHRPDFFSAGCLPYDLNLEDLAEAMKTGWTDELANRLCPTWWRFQQEAVEDPQDIRVNQLMFGDTISNDRTLEKIFIVPGPQRSGKGVTEDALRAVAGEHNVANYDFENMADRYWAVPLIGKSTCIFSDAHFSSADKNTAVVGRLKVVSGNGRIAVRDMHRAANPNFKLNTRFWIFCNDLPDLRDSSLALAGRLVVLPRERSFYGREDPGLKRDIPGEAAGICIWTLLGARDLLAMNSPKIQMSAVGERKVRLFSSMSSTERSFLDDCCELRQNAEIAAPDLYEVYQAWCQAEGHHPVGRNKLAMRIATHVPGFMTTDDTGRKVFDRHGKLSRAYWGITLRDRVLEDDQDDDDDRPLLSRFDDPGLGGLPV